MPSKTHSLTILESITAFASNFPRNLNFAFNLLTTAAFVFLARGAGKRPHGENMYRISALELSAIKYIYMYTHVQMYIFLNLNLEKSLAHVKVVIASVTLINRSKSSMLELSKLLCEKCVI